MVVSKPPSQEKQIKSPPFISLLENVSKQKFQRPKTPGDYTGYISKAGAVKPIQSLPITPAANCDYLQYEVI